MKRYQERYERVHVYDTTPTRLETFGTYDPRHTSIPYHFFAPHTVAADSTGRVFVGEGEEVYPGTGYVTRIDIDSSDHYWEAYSTYGYDTYHATLTRYDIQPDGSLANGVEIAIPDGLWMDGEFITIGRIDALDVLDDGTILLGALNDGWPWLWGLFHLQADGTIISYVRPHADLVNVCDIMGVGGGTRVRVVSGTDTVRDYVASGGRYTLDSTVVTLAAGRTAQSLHRDAANASTWWLGIAGTDPGIQHFAGSAAGAAVTGAGCGYDQFETPTSIYVRDGRIYVLDLNHDAPGTKLDLHYDPLTGEQYALLEWESCPAAAHFNPRNSPGPPVPPVKILDIPYRTGSLLKRRDGWLEARMEDYTGARHTRYSPDQGETWQETLG